MEQSHAYSQDMARITEPSEWISWQGDRLVGINEDGSDRYRPFRYYQCRNCGRRTAVKERFCPSCGKLMKNWKEGA